jgi:hypothetical protein
MPKLKPKPAAAEPLVPPPQPKRTPEDLSLAVADDVEVDTETIWQFIERLAALGKHDRSAVHGLLALHEFASIDDGDFGRNYIGQFVFSLLQRMVWHGVGTVLSDPEKIRKDLDEAIRYMIEDAHLARKTVNRYSDLLEKQDATKAPTATAEVQDA